MQNQYLSTFTPSLMSSETLEAIFVQREKLAADLVAGIRESAITKNKHYRLLVGMRGIGKTHTIALIYHRLINEADLQDKLIIAWLEEEEYISSWLDLQISIFQALNNLYSEEYQSKLAAKVEALYKLPVDEATLKGETILKKFVGDRTLLLLTENLDEIFAGLKDKGQKKFRAYLQNHNFITIVATSQSLFNGVTSKKSPFYGFFNPQRLNKLSLTEATDLLTKISQFKQDAELESFVRSQTGQDRIKAIHHLAAGNHRVYIIFSQFLTRESLDELVQPVMQTLDELTPYYQARMQWLSPQQRKIIDLLCDRRGAVPVKEIAQRCFISHQTASSQLKDLLIKGYVGKESKGRESFYELQEPLMRICLEAKKQRGEPIKLFVDFLCIWYTEKELKQILKTLPENCIESNYIKYALKTRFNKTKFLEMDCKQKVFKYIEEENNKLYFLIEPKEHNTSICFENSKMNVLNKKNAYEIHLQQALEFFKNGDWQQSAQQSKQAIQLNPESPESYKILGNALQRMGKISEAMSCYAKAVEIEPDLGKVYAGIGDIYFKEQKWQQALKNYQKAIIIKPSPEKYCKIACIFYKIGDLDNSSLYMFKQIEMLLRLNNWKEAFKALDKTLSCFKKKEKLSVENASKYIEIIWDKTINTNASQFYINALVESYNKHRAISFLSKGVVDNIPNIISEMVSNKAAKTWLEVWQEVAGDKPELEIALRWLKTAVEYKESKGDRRVLFQLPKEERDLFITLLDETDKESNEPAQ